jgi:DNA-binding MarR family transcriptional regulator
MKTDNTISLIARIHEKINKKLVLALKEKGIEDLAPSHGDILAALFKKDRVTMATIAALIHRDKSTVTQLIKKLVKKGYISIEINPLDRRSFLVCLTQKGRGLEKIFQNISNAAYTSFYNNMKPEEIAEFQRLVKIINENV